MQTSFYFFIKYQAFWVQWSKRKSRKRGRTSKSGGIGWRLCWLWILWLWTMIIIIIIIIIFIIVIIIIVIIIIIIMPLGPLVFLCSLWEYDINDNIWSHFLYFCTQMLQFSLISCYPSPLSYFIYYIRRYNYSNGWILMRWIVATIIISNNLAILFITSIYSFWFILIQTITLYT